MIDEIELDAQDRMEKVDGYADDDDIGRFDFFDQCVGEIRDLGLCGIAVFGGCEHRTQPCAVNRSNIGGFACDDIGCAQFGDDVVGQLQADRALWFDRRVNAKNFHERTLSCVGLSAI